jgi:hypothetical protein
MPEAALTAKCCPPSQGFPRFGFPGSLSSGPRSAASSSDRAPARFPNPKTEEYDQCPSTNPHPRMKTPVEDHPSVHPISNSSGPPSTSAFRPLAKAFDGCSGSLWRSCPRLSPWCPSRPTPPRPPRRHRYRRRPRPCRTRRNRSRRDPPYRLVRRPQLPDPRRTLPRGADARSDYLWRASVTAVLSTAPAEPHDPRPAMA